MAAGQYHANAHEGGGQYCKCLRDFWIVPGSGVCGAFLKPLQLYFFNAGAIDFGDVEFEVFEAQRFI